MRDDASADARTAVRAMVGAQLRRFRLRRNLTLEAVAEAVSMSVPTLWRMERGQAPLRPGTLVTLLTAYGVTDPLEQDIVLSVATGKRKPGWWFDDALPFEETVQGASEQAAQLIRTYQPFVVPELLRTEEYARAAHLARHYPSPPSDATESHVKNLMRRQQERSARLWAVIDEPVLWRRFGDIATHLRQLDALISAGNARDITVQILPMESPFLPHAAAFTIFNLPDARRILTVHRYTGDTTADLAAAEHWGLLFSQLIGVAKRRCETSNIIARIRDRLQRSPSGGPV
jgi:transcriptional regulator with XRE-family HTH domain